MNAQPLSPPHKPDSLSLIREGMPVKDKDGHSVGSVKSLYLGAAADALDQPSALPETAAGTAPVTADGGIGWMDPFGADSALPKELRQRLRYNGFVQIDAGALHRDRYALREQVAGISGDTVQLNVAGDDLIKA